MTVGMMMYYGGIAGAALGLIILILLSKVFAVQRKNKRNSINIRNQN